MESLSKRCKVYNRRLIADDRGWFLKTLTGTEDGLPAHTGEIYLTMANPGQSKGGHYHPQACEWFTVIEGEGLLKLEDIITHERVDIKLSLAQPVTVFIPNKVAHSIVNTSESRKMVLLAYTDRLYHPSDTISYSIN